MSDTETQTLTASGSGKSQEEVAFDLLNKLKGQGVWGERNKDAILDMYSECLDATKGLRAYQGQNRIQTPITSPRPPQSAPASPQSPRAAARVPSEPATQQPVQMQQHALQQAFKPG